MKNGLLAIVIIAILVGVVFYFNQSSALTKRDERPEVGFIAPDFTLTNEQGDRISLSQYRGKPVFINFWASWCPPCKEEMPFIQEAYEKYKDEVVFIGLNITVNDVKEEAIAFMDAYGYQMPILFDYDGKVTLLYRAKSIPTSFFIDKNGIIKETHTGPMNLPQIENFFDSIMGD